MTGSDDMAEQPLDFLRARQEREVAAEHSLATMEYALGSEAFHIVLMLRESGLELDPLTLVALRVLEACVAENVEPAEFIGMLLEKGSFLRSVEIAEELLDRDAA